MFEKSNQIAKFYGNGKLTSVKLTRKRNNKKKSEYDPDYHVTLRVELATFDPVTKKQQESVYGSLSMDEAAVFINALEIYGKKAYQIKIANQQKMPEVSVFEKWAGYESEGRCISTLFSVRNGGPNMNADFFVVIDEAEGYKDEKTGLFKRGKGARSIRKLQMSLRAEDAISMAEACRNAMSILNMWSALGTLDENLDRIAPFREANGAGYGSYQPAQPRNQQPQGGYGNGNGYGGGNGGYVEPQYGNRQGYAAQGGYSGASGW